MSVVSFITVLDYRNEYRKTKNNISASRAREDLLGSVQRDIDEFKGLRGGKQEMYAREREHLINSDRLADQAIEIASRTQDNLRHQRRMLSGLSGRLLDMSARIPQLNYIIQKIAMRKRRDTGNEFCRWTDIVTKSDNRKTLAKKSSWAVLYHSCLSSLLCTNSAESDASGRKYNYDCVLSTFE